MSALDKNREFCARMMREDPYNAPKWEMVRRWANKDCNRDLIVGYPFEHVKWWKTLNEWIRIDERDMPVLEVVAGTLLVCGDEPREEQLMKEGCGREELKQMLLCAVWEEIIKGADKLIESGWTPESAPPGPVEAKVVAVADGVKAELGAAVADKIRNKGGRPRNSDRAAGSMTQREVAAMFNLACRGDVCNESMVSNWESFVRTDGRRGASPPEAEYNGRSVVYTADLRMHPTAKNMTILAAIIERFRSTRAVKDGIAARDRQRYKSEESLFRARGGVQAELAKRRE